LRWFWGFSRLTEFPLSRSQQLLICVALALTRELIYDTFIAKQSLKALTAEQFEV
jgi:hypothetical protein